MPRLYYLKENVSGTATAAATLLPYGGTEYYAQRAGRVRALTLLATEARTAGTLTAKVRVNGAASSVLAPQLTSAPSQFAEAFGDEDDLTYAAGARIGIDIITAGWTPTTSDAIAILDLEE